MHSRVTLPSKVHRLCFAAFLAKCKCSFTAVSKYNMVKESLGVSPCIGGKQQRRCMPRHCHVGTSAAWC